MCIAQGVFGNQPVLVLTQDEANSRVILFMPKFIIYHSTIKIELSCVFWPEFACLQFNNNIAAQFEMVEQKVQEELLSCYFKMDLLAYIGKTGTKFEQEICNMPDQFLFLFFFFLGKKIKNIRIFQKFVSQIRLWSRN